MAKETDVGFTFDPKPFLAGINKTEKGIAQLVKQTAHGAKAMGDAMFGAMLKMGGLAVAIKGVQGAIGVVKQQIPEIGQAFGIAKEIFFKNLFWPLRQMVVPMLQKMLDWVRNNRAMFVQWGQVIVSVFKIAIQVAQTLIKILEPLMGALFKNLGGNMTDAINLVLAKVAVIVTYIGILVKPLIAIISEIVTKIGESGVIKSFIDLAVAVAGVAWNAITSFLEGLSKPISNSDAFSKLSEAFQVLAQGLDALAKNKSFKAVMDMLGQLVGTALVTGIQAIAAAIEMLGTGLTTLSTGMIDITRTSSGFDKFIGGLKAMTGQGGQAEEAFAAAKFKEDKPLLIAAALKASEASNADLIKQLRSKARLNAGEFSQLMALDSNFKSNYTEENRLGTRSYQKIKDGVVQGGKAVGTDPQDVIVAHKGTVSINKKQTGSAQGSWTVNIQVTEGGAREAGSNFAEGMQYQMRALLATESMIGGR